MKTYIGTKIIKAVEMDENSYLEEKGNPTPAETRPGYKVEYEDGYVSWSPDYAFEKAYRLADGMNFGLAIEALRKGKKVARSGWNGVGLWLELQVPDAHSKMTLPYIYINYPDNAKNTPGARCPWLASQTDMLADDWRIVE